MPKTCQKEGCNYPVWGKGYCKYHQYLRTDRKQPKQRKNTKALKFASKKRLKRLANYRKKRDAYLKENNVCEVHDCSKRSTNLHHKMGRQGFADDYARENDITLVEDERFFMACCETCHPKRIHENPIWARDHGYILNIKSI